MFKIIFFDNKILLTSKHIVVTLHFQYALSFAAEMHAAVCDDGMDGVHLHAEESHHMD